MAKDNDTKRKQKYDLCQGLTEYGTQVFNMTPAQLMAHFVKRGTIPRHAATRRPVGNPHWRTGAH